MVSSSLALLNLIIIFLSLSSFRSSLKSLTQEKHLKDKAQKRREEISQVLRAMKKASIVDVCFLLDCTGSMRSFIEEVKSKINWLVAEITQRHKDVETLNLAFVGYRDLCNKEKNYSILQFTKSATVFRDFVAGVKAEGGCSHTADVAGGLDQVRSPTQIRSTYIVFRCVHASL